MPTDKVRSLGPSERLVVGGLRIEWMEPSPSLRSSPLEQPATGPVPPFLASIIVCLEVRVQNLMPIITCTVGRIMCG